MGLPTMDYFLLPHIPASPRQEKFVFCSLFLVPLHSPGLRRSSLVCLFWGLSFIFISLLLSGTQRTCAFPPSAHYFHQLLRAPSQYLLSLHPNRSSPPQPHQSAPLSRISSQKPPNRHPSRHLSSQRLLFQLGLLQLWPQNLSTSHASMAQSSGKL